ncbi:hypothetical protein Leryth_007547 [Lithospermum erythrorhizon]|nr:hypothetical protein Leryth_007547 [Lithospermum erythrorhizon]
MEGPQPQVFKITGSRWWLEKKEQMIKPCWRQPSVVEGGSKRGGYEIWRRSDDPNGKVDGLMWYKDLGSHVSGEFSMAATQANGLMEDQSQLESGPLSTIDSGPNGTFVGVYDGHGGPETSRFVNDNLFLNLKSKFSSLPEKHRHSRWDAFVEEEFLSVVRQQWRTKPQLASVGTCCLAGVICNGLLYVANAGDSRVVLGRAEKAVRGVTAVQLSTDHNANIESVSRSIGDAYLKSVEFNKEPLLPKFRIYEFFSKPLISPEPSIFIHKLNPRDQFLIFASDGLWEHLSNQEAVDIVHSYPRNGIARRLVKEALKVAAKKREMRYSDLKKIDRGVRRHFHDDITVVVVYLDPSAMNNRTSPGISTTVSIRGDGGAGFVSTPK